MTARTSEARRREKRRRILVQLGIPSLVTPEEFEEAAQKARVYHARGMAVGQIAQGAGTDTATISELISGTRGPKKGPIGTINRRTYNGVMRLEFALPAALGARCSPLGARRRLQALTADGYGLDSLALALGWDRACVGKLVSGQRGRKYIHWTTHQAVDAVWLKLQGVRPADSGVTAYQISRAQGAARRHGYAPSHTWDPDTIDDPHAEPEWTGECGTTEGWSLHNTKKIPMCGPCQDAHRRDLAEKAGTRGRGAPQKINRAEVFQHFDEGRSIRETAAAVGADQRTITRIRGEWKQARGEWNELG